MEFFCLDCSGTDDTKFLVSGSADNTMKLWDVQTGVCLYTWEFPTAVKRVSFSTDMRQILCLTEQRMGHQSAIRIFDINREDGTKRTSHLPIYSVKTDSIHDRISLRTKISDFDR